MGCKHQVDISNIRYMILNHSLNVLLLFQGSNVALCELGTFKFRFRTTNTHIPEAMKGTVYKWEIYSRNLIGKQPEKGFIIQCRNFRDSRGAPSFRWSMWVVSLIFFRVVFFPFYISSRILIDSNLWMCQNFDFEAIQKQKRLSKGITAKTNPLHLPYRLFSKAGRHHHVFFPSRRLHWRFQVDLEGCWKIKSDMAGGAFFDVPWACWDGWAVF